MFDAYIRAAAAFAGAMLLSTVAREVTEPYVLPRLADAVGTDSLVYTSIDGVVTYLPFIVLLAIAVGVIARSATESRYPR